LFFSHGHGTIPRLPLLPPWYEDEQLCNNRTASNAMGIAYLNNLNIRKGDVRFIKIEKELIFRQQRYAKKY